LNNLYHYEGLLNCFGVAFFVNEKTHNVLEISVDFLHFLSLFDATQDFLSHVEGDDVEVGLKSLLFSIFERFSMFCIFNFTFFEFLQLRFVLLTVLIKLIFEFIKSMANTRFLATLLTKNICRFFKFFD